MSANEIVDRIEASRLKPEIAAIMEIEPIPPSYVAGDDTRIEPAEAPPFALDGSGGTFHILADGRILLVDSEGSFGVVARNFPEFVGITTGLPGWRDALRFVGEPDPAQANARWEAYVRKWGLNAVSNEPWPYAPENFSVATPAEARAAIRAAFGVAEIPDPFGTLYQAVNALSRDLSVSQGDAPLLLFGREP